MYNWSAIAIRDIRMEQVSEIEVGETYIVQSDVHLGELKPQDVVVEAYCGRVDPSNRYLDTFTVPMGATGIVSEKTYRYQCEVRFRDAGRFGVNLRVTPNHPNPESRHAMGLVVWGQS
jgi:starch phosphorylase